MQKQCLSLCLHIYVCLWFWCKASLPSQHILGSSSKRPYTFVCFVFLFLNSCGNSFQQGRVFNYEDKICHQSLSPLFSQHGWLFFSFLLFAEISNDTLRSREDKRLPWHVEYILHLETSFI